MTADSSELTKICGISLLVPLGNVIVLFHEIRGVEDWPASFIPIYNQLALTQFFYVYGANVAVKPEYVPKDGFTYFERMVEALVAAAAAQGIRLTLGFSVAAREYTPRGNHRNQKD
jgi:hypothetical protein